MDYEKTGRLIAERRRELGMTQLQLSEKIGVSNRTVSKWETGAGFPDVSLLEPLADALGVSVIELMHGEREACSTDSDEQVREALRIVGAELRKKLLLLKRIAKGVALAAVLLVIGWNVFEFLATNGDGFDHGVNARTVRSGQQNDLRSLDGRGIYRIEVASDEDVENTVITDEDDIARIIDVLSTVELGREYSDWGPRSLRHKIIIFADGWTNGDGTYLDTEDYRIELTFPAFSLMQIGEVRSEPRFYYKAEIGGGDAWSVIEKALAETSE